MNWLKVVGDIYAAQQHLNLINQCPKYVEEGKTVIILSY